MTRFLSLFLICLGEAGKASWARKREMVVREVSPPTDMKASGLLRSHREDLAQTVPRGDGAQPQSRWGTPRARPLSRL